MTFVLVPGAGTGPGYWDLVANDLRARGHDVVAVDLPCDDDTAGLAEYADAAVRAIDGRGRVVVVGHSLGGFTAASVCARTDVDLLVLVQAMMPVPGESPADWFEHTGAASASGDDHADPDDAFFNDVPAQLVALAKEHERPQSGTPMTQPWPFEHWPDVPTRFLVCSEDHFLSPEVMRRLARERLGIIPDEIATGHMPMLAQPAELADRLHAYAQSY